MALGLHWVGSLGLLKRKASYHIHWEAWHGAWHDNPSELRRAECELQSLFASEWSAAGGHDAAWMYTYSGCAQGCQRLCDMSNRCYSEAIARWA